MKYYNVVVSAHADHTEFVEIEDGAGRSVAIEWEPRDVPDTYDIPIVSYDFFGDVADLYKQFGFAYEGKPRAMEFKSHKFRADHMQEELQEYRSHMAQAFEELDAKTVNPKYQLRKFDEANFVHHLAEAFDALIDLVVVALGTAQLHGFPFNEGWERVMAANRLKQLGVNPTRVNHGVPDLIKLPGWESPKHDDLVEDHAHGSDQDEEAV